MRDGNVLRVGVLCALLTGFTACSTGEIESQKDPNVDMARYRTYAWLTQEDAKQLDLENPKIDYIAGAVRVVQKPEIEQKIRDVVETDLRKQGFQPAQSGNPDFYVTFYGKAKNEDWVSSWHGFTAGVQNIPIVMYPDLERASAFRYQEGTLLVVFYDPKTRRPAWTGSIFGVLSGQAVNEAQVATSLKLLIQDFKKSTV